MKLEMTLDRPPTYATRPRLLGLLRAGLCRWSELLRGAHHARIPF